MSPEIWKTLKVWMDDGAPADTGGPALSLVSTGKAAPDSAAMHLKPGEGRNPAAAADKLRKAAAESRTMDKNLVAAFDKFKELSVPAQNAFIARITIVDAVPTIVDIATEVKKRIWTHLPADPKKHVEFLERLWGWWRGRVVEMLTQRYFPNNDSLRRVVTSADLNAQLLQLTVAYSDQGLPEFDEFDVDYTDKALKGLDDEVFVHQLAMVKVHDVVIRKAIVDFYRATHSEVRWLERDFLRSDEVQRYERRLREAWEVAFGLMLSELPACATDEDQETAGRALLREILSKPAIRIRDRVDQDFYFRGKHHMLAQRPDLGWHPDFEARVKELLLGTKAAV